MKTIVIIGATGQQGGSVARTFAREPTWHVRAVTRDPSKTTSQQLEAQGVEVVAGNLDDPSSLQAAFTGAHAIFGVTDFWQFAKDPAVHKVAAERGIWPNVVCYERELGQAKNIIDAAAAAGDSLERFVFSTLSDTKKWSNGKIVHNYHFDSKAAASHYLNATYPALAAKTSNIQLGMYMANWQMSSMMGPRIKQDGKNFVFRKPSMPDARPTPWVHPPQDTGPCVKALVTNMPPETNMLMYSQYATPTEYCALWQRVMRQRRLIEDDATCEADLTMTYDEAAETMPGPFGIEVRDAMRYGSEYGWTGGDTQVKSPSECGVDPRDLSSLEHYMLEEDWSSILTGARPSLL